MLMSASPRATPLGAYIRNVRQQRNMTQELLADLVGTSPAYVSQIETGRVVWPGPHLRRAIAAALGVSHLELLIAAGELTRDEAGTPPPDALAAVHARLDPHLARLAPADLETLLRVAESLARREPAAVSTPTE